jgi:hypothetical protein
VTNISLDPSAYVGQNTKMLPSVFHQWNQNDMINFLAEHNVETIVEDNGRVLLKSGKSKELLELLIHLTHENNVETILSQNITDIERTFDDHFLITTQDDAYRTKKLIIASGGMTYPQVGATPFGYELAERL